MNNGKTKVRGTIEGRRNLSPITYTPQQVEEHKKLYRKYLDKVKSGEWKTRTYNEFLQIISNKMLPLVEVVNIECPFCASQEVQKLGSRCTLIGYYGKYDPNHVWVSCRCKSCNASFTQEYKGTENGYNVWYTVDNRVVLGLPTCYESYIYTCNCGGEVTRKHIDKATNETAKYTITTIGGDGEVKSNAKIIFSCNQCKAEVESNTEYYYFSSPYVPRKPWRPYCRWKIYEEVGVAIINDIALKSSEK